MSHKSSSSSSRSSKQPKRRGQRSKGMLTSGPSLSRATEKHHVFNSLGDPQSWRLPVPPPTAEYWCVTATDTPAYLTSSAGAEVDQGLTFTLSGINATELAGYQALFDQYRIRWIELMLVPRSNGVNASASTNLGRLCTATDFDSAAATTFANLETYTNSIVTSGGVAHYRAFKPCVTVASGASGSGTTVNTLAVCSPWLDLAVTGTQHYGFKVAISVTDAAYVFDLFTRFHLSFRQKI